MKNTHPPTERHASDDFLTRWSSRKHEAKQALSPPEDEVQEETEVEAVSLPTDADMPPIETLEESSDYTGFLSPEVSEELRCIALRKLFHGAAFTATDGLDDYADDFSSFAKLGDLITSDMRFQMEEAAKKVGFDQLAEDESDPHPEADQEVVQRVADASDQAEDTEKMTMDKSEASEVDI